MIARIHCAAGHWLRWNAGKKRYVHVRYDERGCAERADATRTTWRWPR